MTRWRGVIFLFLLCLPLVMAAPPFQATEPSSGLAVIYPKLDAYQAGINATFHVHVFDEQGRPVNNDTVVCDFHVYNQLDGHVLKDNLTFDGLEWETDLNASLLTRTGTFPYIIYCYNSTVGGYASASFMVTTTGLPEQENATPMVLVSFLPILFGFLLVLGARLFDPEQHWVLQVAVYILSLVSTITGLWWAGLAVIRFTEWGELQEAVATWSFVSGIFVAVIGAYWLIFVFVRLVHIIAEKKERRLEG